MSKFRPLSNMVLIKVHAPKEETKGGLIIPTEAQERRTEGIIVRIGSGPKAKAGEIKPGDEIIFEQYRGLELTEENGDQVLLMDEENLLVVIEQPSKKRRKKKSMPKDRR